MKKILQYKEKAGARVLRGLAREIPIRDIKTKRMQSILQEMSSTLKSQDDGVAIAAPQIGYPFRIFLVSGKIFSPGFTRGKGLPAEENTDPKLRDLVFINPKISKLSREKEWLPEGCLSVRWLYGSAHRSKKATVTAYDENGKKFTRGASGLLAQIFQHETDHLEGILFIDHAKDIREELPQ